MKAGTFSLVPLEINLDRRLTWEQARVLIALLSFRNRVTNTCWPSRAELAERACLHVSNVSAATTALAELGWLEKSPAPGGKGVQYTLTIPAHLAEQATDGKPNRLPTPSRIGYSPLAEQATVAEQATGGKPIRLPTPSRIGYSPIADSATRNIPRTDQEQTKEQTNDDADARASQTEDKRPRGASRGGQGGQNGEPAKPVERKRKTAPKPKSAMTADWQPDAKLWDDLATLGIDRDFAQALLPEFRRYWEEERAGEERPGWNRTFLAHVQRNWRREKERPTGGTNLTPLRPLAGSAHRGRGDFRTFEQRRAENTQRAIDEFLHGDNVGDIIDA